MKEIKAIVRPFMTEKIIGALRESANLPGITVSQVTGFGRYPTASDNPHDAAEVSESEAAMTKIEIVVPDALSETVLGLLLASARTGNLGDGKVFIYDVGDVIRIRTGEHGEKAI